MSEVIKWLTDRTWQFLRKVQNRNHDLPYHDYFYIDNSEGQDALNGCYVVGTNNKDAHGDQHKLFVSKRTLIGCQSEDAIIRLNDSHNVNIMGLPTSVQNPVWLYTNIHAVYYSVPVSGTLIMYFEGVLPEEARNPE